MASAYRPEPSTTGEAIVAWSVELKERRTSKVDDEETDKSWEAGPPDV
jgi:hypothetical protein